MHLYSLCGKLWYSVDGLFVNVNSRSIFALELLEIGYFQISMLIFMPLY